MQREDERKAEESEFVGALRRLYADERFLPWLFGFDLATVLAFLVLTFVPPAPWVAVADAVIGTLMLVELAGRLIVEPRRLAFLRRPTTLLDIVIIVSLLAPPLTGSFAFLRILRAMRLFRLLAVIRRMKHRHRWLAERGELIGSAANLLIFLLVTSSVIYEAQVDSNPGIRTFIDALYFTVATLTTTGFGDIVLVGEGGRLLSVVVMIVGVSLFLKLAQSIIRPSKVHYSCADCGLSRHDPDAVHCKHCGAVVKIETEGAA